MLVLPINAVFDTALVGNTNATIQVSVPITSGSIVLPIPTTPIVPSQNTTIPFISGTLGILGNNLGGCTSGCVLQPTALTGASILTPLGLVSIGNFNSGGISSTTALNGTSLFNVSASSIAFSTGEQQNFLNQEVIPSKNSASVLVFTGNTSGVAAFTPTGAFNNASTTINATFNTALPSAGLTQVSIPITSGSIVLPIADPSITPPPQNNPITPPPQNPSITPPPQNTPIAFAISTTPVNTDLLLALRSSTEINSDDLQKDKEDFSFSPFSSCRFLQTEDK